MNSTDAKPYGDPCLCCGSLMGCYCHEYPHLKKACPGAYNIPLFDWLICWKQWGVAVAWKPRGESAIEFLIGPFVLTFRWLEGR